MEINIEKFMEGVKKLKEKTEPQEPIRTRYGSVPPEKVTKFRRILLMIESGDIDFDMFTLEDIEQMLEVYYDEREDLVEKGLSEYMFIKERVENFKSAPLKGGEDVFI